MDNYHTNIVGQPVHDEHARAFVTRWSASAGAERGNFQMFYTELADLIGLPHPEPSFGGVGEYVFERSVTFPNGKRGRADLFKIHCAVIEAKQFGRLTGTSSGSSALHPAGEARGRSTIRRGTAAWEKGMRAAARQGVRYARALAPEGSAPPFVIAIDIGYAFDLHFDLSGTGSAYVRYPAMPRLRMEDLLRADVRAMLRLILSDPQALDCGYVDAQEFGCNSATRPDLIPSKSHLQKGGQVVRESSHWAWPEKLAEQVERVLEVARVAAVPVSSAEVAAVFTGARQAAVIAVLDALAALGLLHVVEGGRYSA